MQSAPVQSPPVVSSQAPASPTSSQSLGTLPPQMTSLQGKTPISFLQELCTKRGITPQYDLIANEGAVHEPTFVFRVTAGEYVGTGRGERTFRCNPFYF